MCDHHVTFDNIHRERIGSGCAKTSKVLPRGRFTAPFHDPPPISGKTLALCAENFWQFCLFLPKRAPKMTFGLIFGSFRCKNFLPGVLHRAKNLAEPPKRCLLTGGGGWSSGHGSMGGDGGICLRLRQNVITLSAPQLNKWQPYSKCPWGGQDRCLGGKLYGVTQERPFDSPVLHVPANAPDLDNRQWIGGGFACVFLQSG